MPEEVDDSALIPGDRWRATHESSVRSILGSLTPRVLSMGVHFYNFDRFTGVALARCIQHWAKENPSATPDAATVEGWVSEANTFQVSENERRIVIAETPKFVDQHTALALVGGAYHEAFHTLYSTRKDLDPANIVPEILKRWPLVTDWSVLMPALKTWWNVIEDVRIERAGHLEWPGTYDRLQTLAEFVMDREGVKEPATEYIGSSKAAASVVVRAFRDLGMPYTSSRFQSCVSRYAAEEPEAFAIVESGPLRPMLDRVKKLTKHDDLEPLFIAMDILAELSTIMDPEDIRDAAAEANLADPGHCPKCNAPPGARIARPIPDGNGGVVKGKVRITCTACGHQDDVDVSSGSSKSNGAGPQNGVGLNAKSKKKKKGGGSGRQDPNKMIQFDGDIDDVLDLEDEDEGDEDEGESGDSESGEGEGDDGDGEEDKSGESESGAGVGPEELQKIRDLIRPLLSNEAKILDGSEAITNRLLEIIGNEDEPCQQQQSRQYDAGERVWRPYTTSYDTMERPVPRPEDVRLAFDIRREVQKTSSSLQAKLRMLFQSASQRAIVHGARNGDELSDLMLVDTVSELRNGIYPTRPFQYTTDRRDTRAAFALVIDESGSMHSLLKQVTMTMIALSESLDMLHCPTMIVGFRNGRNHVPTHPTGSEASLYHRTDSMLYDVFKTFDERFTQALPRMACTKADSSTPMSDGIQVGLHALAMRREAIKVCFVLTDGVPDPGHMPVIRWQVKHARSLGITLFGLGVGHGAQEVLKTFPESAWSPTVEELPQRLIQVLIQKLDFRRTKPGHR